MIYLSTFKIIVLIVALVGMATVAMNYAMTKRENKIIHVVTSYMLVPACLMNVVVLTVMLFCPLLTDGYALLTVLFSACITLMIILVSVIFVTTIIETVFAIASSNSKQKVENKGEVY
ncbi:hypothetical protein [Solibacillus sp. NPDC093137]|uniref:hypothetical protein n=1 Tax=Solibacillus sp. NPDC093137 TaxID=3390678 RepID=UPI003CFF6E01